MERVTYQPTHGEEVLDIDPVTNEPIVISLPPRKDDYMVIVFGVAFAVIAAVVVLIFGLGFMDLAFGTT